MSIILTAKGSLDQHLIGNPQISFFKIVYRRHTNFSMQPMQIPLEGNITDTGGYFQTKISRSGDLINKLWFDCRISASNSSSLTSNDYFTWTRNTGAAYIKDYSLQIGQQIIDKQDSDFLNIYSEIYDPFNDSWSGLNKSVARDKVYYNQEFSINHAGMNPNGYLQLYIDLHFWFCKENRPALPIICIQNQDITLNYNIRSTASLINGSFATTAVILYNTDTLKLYGNYIYLDTDERRRFVQTTQEYLIEQIQYLSKDLIPGSTNNIQLNFNNPIKQLFWFIRNNKSNTEVLSDGSNSHVYYKPQNLDVDVQFDLENNHRRFSNNDYFNYNASSMDANLNQEFIANVRTNYNFKTANISVNDVELFSPQKTSFFELQTYNHAHVKLDTSGGLFMYSFALKPEGYQPTGTFNMTYVDRCTLNLYDVKFDSTNDGPTHVKVYAINYNILRIMSGMAALAYNN